MFKLFERLCRVGRNQQLEAFCARLDALENTVQEQASALQQQSTVLQEILDKVSPATMPPEWETRLTQALSPRLDALENTVQEQASVFQRQSTVLQEILEMVSPATMPPEWETRLT